MTAATFLRQVLRESRGQRRRLLFFTLCLAVGVAAVTSVAGLASSLDSAIRGEARQLLAADLVVEGRRPLPTEVETAIEALPGIRRADLKELPTVVAAPPRDGRPGPSQLVELKAVSPGYPFYGELRLGADAPTGLVESFAEGLGAEAAVVAPELLAALSLEVGDALRIGGEDFRILATLDNEPDRLANAFALGPRVFLSLAGLERANLEQFGSRILYRALLRLPDATETASLEATAESLKEAIPDGSFHRVETYAQAQPALRRGLDRTERFLGLVALLSLLVGGIGVAQTVRAWLAGRMDAIAILKCLGMRPREILGLYVAQTGLMALLGSLAGAMVGILTLWAAPRLLPDLIPAGAVSLWQPWALARGLALGLGVALLFSLPPLLALRRVPPARVLRRDAEPLAGSRRSAWVLAGLTGLGLLVLAMAQSRSFLLGAGFTAGVAVSVGALTLAALGLTRLAARVPRRSPLLAGRFWLRHGLAALARPGAATLSAVIALGLGVLVVLAMFLVESQLSNQLEADLPTAAPNLFLVDIQPDQWVGVREAMADEAAERIDSVPVVTARLLAIDGVSTQSLAEESEPEDGDRRWALTREQRLTYLDQLPDDNEIIAGELWADPQVAEASVEEDFAAELQVGLGSVLRFDIQGVPLELTVTSLRTVDWESFGINFFVVVEPGVLEEAPQQRIAAAKLPDGAEQRLQNRLAASYPNVTVLNLEEILAKVARVLRRVGLGVRMLGSFTVLAGIAILIGAVSAGSARRGQEVALLKTLGLTRAGVAAAFAVEYSLVGLVAGLIGIVSGGLLGWVVLTRGMEVDWTFSAAPYLVALAATVLLAVLAGLASSIRALRQRPVESLRQM